MDETLNAIKENIRNAQFRPTILSMLTNPFYFARKGLYQNIASLSCYIKGSVLDVGCGHKPYKSLFATEKYVGLEIDSEENRLNKHADIFYDGSMFPFEDSEFDSVVINQVLEHVFEPNFFLSEVERVLKNEGLLLLTVPFIWDEHEVPVDYARYSSYGLSYLMKRHHFEIVELRKSVSGIRVIFQIFNAFLYKTLLPRNQKLSFLLTLLLLAPVNILGELANLVAPNNEDLYLDNVILAVLKKDD